MVFLEKNLKSYWISTIEILKSFKINGLKTNIFFIIMRIPAKIVNYFFIIKILLINHLNYLNLNLKIIIIKKIVLKL